MAAIFVPTSFRPCGFCCIPSKRVLSGLCKGINCDCNSDIRCYIGTTISTEGLVPLDTTTAPALQLEAEPDFTSNQQRSWDIGQQRVICGDCLTELQNLPDSSVDVVVTSPPYNIGARYRDYDDNKPRSDYLAWLADVGRQLHRVLKDDGSLFLNIGSTNADPWISKDVAATFRDQFVLQNDIVWVKSISIGDDSHGHFKPITSRRFLNHNELLSVLTGHRL